MKSFWYISVVILFAVFAADLLVGSAAIPVSDVLRALSGGPVDEQTRIIITDIRLPKAITAILAGAAVSLSGLLMQTVFRNPLAGPYVLGISSGASLGAAVFVLGLSPLSLSGTFAGSLGLAGAAWIGSAAILALIAFAGRKIKDIMVILILGMMAGAAIDSFVQILQYLSDEVSLKSYIVWTMGSLGTVSWNQLGFLSAAAVIGTAIAFASSKALNLFLLGPFYAASMGLNVSRSRNVIFLSTTILAGTVTAFCGPLGFIGLAVPHLTRLMLRNADHRVLIPGTVLTGAVFMLLCDVAAKITTLPVNAITSLSGIPVVVWVVLKYKD